jgi:ribosomal 30S subunit maturation factor RimM
VRTASGRPVGEVRDVLETPAHEILVVQAPEGPDVLIPLVDELLTLEEDAMIVVDGLLDEPEG